jgi:tetratricopeptide (TPR) repeat protein
MSQAAALTKESLHQIIEAQPASELAARARYELGGLHLAGGNVEVATTLYRDVPARWSRWHARAGLAIARIYDQHVKDIEAAAREYRKVIRLHPESYAAAEGYSRMAEIYELVGDPVSAENMRDCALRTYDRILDSTDDHDEREAALVRFVQTSRLLERWDLATEALVKARRQAVKDGDAARQVDLDRQLGLIYFDREQFGNALIRFKTCLQHARRRGELGASVTLTELVARCEEALDDRAGERRTWRAFLEWVRRSPDRKQRVQRDPALVGAYVRALLATDKAGEARQVRARLKRLKGGKDALILVEALLDERDAAAPSASAAH